MIIQDFAPTSLPNIPNYTMNPEFITIHNTGNSNKGANAEMHNRYLKNGAGGRSASWHFTVDDKEIYQHIPTNRNAWHCADGLKGTGNRKSIGVEICHNSDGDYKKAEQNAIELIRELMHHPEKFQHESKISLENVVPHFHWYNKNCPVLILPRWDEFIAEIEKNKVKSMQELKPTKIIDERSSQTIEAFIVNGVTYAPIRQIAEVSGRIVFWDGKNVILK